jgi:hypothetical protein
MTLPNDHFVVLRSDHFEVKVMGPSDEWIGALSRSISTAGISKMFALVLPSLATNQLKLLLVASRIGSERQCDWVLFLLGNLALRAGPFVFVVAHKSYTTARKVCFSLRFDAATRLPSNVKEKQWLNGTENGEPGHQNMFAH